MRKEKNYKIPGNDCKKGKKEYMNKDIDQYNAIMSESKLICKIIGAEQRIAAGEEYMTISELKEKLGM